MTGFEFFFGRWGIANFQGSCYNGNMKKHSSEPVFKPYEMNQAMLLPPSLEELVPQGHLVRVVNHAVERMNLDALLKRYQGGGASSYHPKMMLKVLVYGYTQRLYSSRKIARALRENVHFMWLSGNNRPDFHTINRFRSSVMKGIVDNVFVSILELLVEDGYVKLEDYFLDGTKVEANANRYTAVWAKSVKNYKEKLQQKIRKLLVEIDRANDEENRQYGDRDLEEMGTGPIDLAKIEEKVKELDERLARDPKNKTLAKAVRTLKKDYLPRGRKYEEQEAKLNGRKSYSKTDEDATFMRMKEDHTKNAQPKPGYNVQIGTENQFIVGYSIHQRPADTGCLVPHLRHVGNLLERYPANIIADAGYGSEENYDYLAQKGLGNYVKYSTFDQERSKPRDPFRVDNLSYDAEKDEYICPAGRRLLYQGTRAIRTENGYLTKKRIYQAQDCAGCPVRKQCTRSQDNRRIQISEHLNRLKQTVVANLQSADGRKLCAQRGVEVESVFGRLKHNWGFRRFLLRGLEKVHIEWGLLSIAHNLAKVAVLRGRFLDVAAGV
jgi:transposase